MKETKETQTELDEIECQEQEPEYFESYCPQEKKPTKHIICKKKDEEQFSLCCNCGYRSVLKENSNG